MRGEADALLVDNVTLREAQGQGAAIVAVGPALKAVPTSSPCRCVPMNCTATSPTRSLPYRRTARLTN
ncbi:MAG: hypothetical protein R2838_21665 [Caldilineaceae bacterium]